MAQLRNSRPARRTAHVAPVAALLLAAVPVPVVAGLLSTPAAAAANVGVTIDGGSYATKSAKVMLGLSWPAGATSAVVANDDTFDAAGNATTVGANTTSLRWTLPRDPTPAPSTSGSSGASGTSGTSGSSGASGTSGTASGSERTVYVQFDGVAGGPVTETGHIVLDTTTPQLTAATLLPAKGTRTMPLHVIASDPVSGIAAVQTRPRKGPATTTTLTPPSRAGYPKLDTVVAPKTTRVPVELRVENAAGTWSPWLAVTPQLSALARPRGGTLAAAPNGTKVVLRGFDYQPLKAEKVAGKLEYRNLTFSAGAYKASRVAAIFRQMSQLGYNAVRVFVNVSEIGAVHGNGLNPGYLARMTGLLTRANADGIRVLLCTGELPTQGGYMPRPNALLAGTNAYYLAPADISAKERYLTDLVHGLEADQAPLADVLWELAGEQDWNNHEAPLSLTHRVVRTAAGRFNMAMAASRAAMENANLRHWVDVESNKLHALLPGSLVGVGIYAPSINKKRPGWSVHPAPLFATSSRNDFVDVHVYSNLGSQAVQMRSFHAASTHKVLIMGEFGAARSAFSSPAAGARGELAWQHQSCHMGVHLSGWLLWTWNSGAQREYWTALDGHRAIARAMAPVHRRNPCA